MQPFANILPPEIQNAPVLVTGFVALLGLMLWTAGVKVAKPLAAGLFAAAVAVAASCYLPIFAPIDSLLAALIGLGVGLLIGFTAFRAVQGMILAACLAFLATGTFYHWQVTSHPQAPAKTVPTLDPHSTLGQVVAALPGNIQITAKVLLARWDAIPLSLRQSMLVIAAGVAILAIFVSWLLPKFTTWFMSAVGGTGLILWGGLALLAAFLPQYEHLVPQDTVSRITIVACMVAIGLTIQYFYFWPGRRQKKERAKDRPGELAPA
jgi:hypothetical protein